MEEFQHLFGPVPPGGWARSLDVSPIPGKTCNYACIYCQLGRTDHMTNTRRYFYPVEEITGELDRWLAASPDGEAGFDVVTVVGEGEPTLYAGLGTLLREIRRAPSSRWPSSPTARCCPIRRGGGVDGGGYGASSPGRLGRGHLPKNRPSLWPPAFWEDGGRAGGLFSAVSRPAVAGADAGGGRQQRGAAANFRPLLQRIRYDRLYLNTPVRPPAEKGVLPVPSEKLRRLSEELGGISIDSLTSGAFASEAADDYEAVTGIIRRHP